MAQRQKVMVSHAALMARINRKLAQQDEQLRKSRSARMQFDVGDYFVVDFKRNFIVDKHVDPEELGREIGVLAAWEALEPAER